MHTPLIAAATGLPHGLQPAVGARQFADPLDEDAHRRLLALGLDEPLVVAAHVLEHRQVGAAGKALLAGGDDGALDRGVGGDLVDDRAELRDHVGRK